MTELCVLMSTSSHIEGSQRHTAFVKWSIPGNSQVEQLPDPAIQ